MLRRWRDLGGVLLDAADENELASAVMLARCCSDPPPVSTLAWNPGASPAGTSADGSIDVSNAGPVHAVGKEKLWSSGGVSGTGIGSAGDENTTTLGGDGKDRMWSSGSISGRGLGSVEGSNTSLGSVVRGLSSVGGGHASLGGVGASPFSVYSSGGKDPSGDCIAELWAGGVGDAVPEEASEGVGRLKRSGERLEGGGESQLRRLEGTTDKSDARSAVGGCSMPVSI